MAEDIVTGTFNIFDNSVAVIENSSSPLDYLFRYRLITDEGEALSEWSRVNKVDQGSISGIMGSFVSSVSVSSVESGGAGINVSWTTPNEFPTNKFDIYFSWSYNNGLSFTSFEYEATVTSNNYYIDIPVVSSVKAGLVKVAVQVPTNIKVINTNALLIQSDAKSTKPILDSGNIS
jgi:hypothetical protein